jgi:hypothetical protein
VATRKDKAPKDFGPLQLCIELGWSQWQLERAVGKGLIPAADRPPRRWSAAIVDDVRSRLEEITAALGTVSDCGAGNAAAYLEHTLGVEVMPDTVEELARMGVIAECGEYKDHTLYSGEDLERFADLEVLTRAAERGRLLVTGDAAEFLGCRVSDFEHLVRAKWVEPTKYGRGPFDRRNRTSVPLYRMADLAVLREHPAIDWAAVQGRPKGARSPFTSLAPREKIV